MSFARGQDEFKEVGRELARVAGKNRKSRFRKTFAILAIFIMVVSAVFVAAYFNSNSSNFNSSIADASSPSSPYTYMIYQQGTEYYAKNAEGAITWSSTSASTVIQSAINALPSSGRTIFIAAGTYMLTYQDTLSDGALTCLQLSYQNNITIAGESGTVLELANNQNATMIAIYDSSSNNRITDITFNGNKANNLGVQAGALSPDGVLISLNSNFNTVDHCNFDNIREHSVLIITTSNQNLIEDNTFSGNDWYDIAASGGSNDNVFQDNFLDSSYGLEAYEPSTNGTVIENNILYNTPYYSVATPAISDSGTGTVIQGNYIYNTSYLVMNLVGTGTIVEDNNLYNVATTLTTFPTGAIVVGASGLTIQGNTLVNLGKCSVGIKLTGGNCIVKNNYVTGFVGAGILDYQATGNMISYNRVFSNGASGADIELDTLTTNAQAIGNDFLGSTSYRHLWDRGTNNTLTDNTGYNPLGYIANPILGSYIVDGQQGTSSTWVSGTTYTCWESPKTLYISGGTVTAITVNGQATGLTSGTITLQTSNTFSITFSSAPTITVFGSPTPTPSPSPTPTPSPIETPLPVPRSNTDVIIVAAIIIVVVIIVALAVATIFVLQKKSSKT